MYKTENELTKLIDHTALHPAVSKEELKTLCDEAREYQFKMVAVNQVSTEYCAEQLENDDVHVGAAIGFPFGQTTIKAKVFETKDAIENGADEIDYVINISELKAGNTNYIKREMREIVELCRNYDVLVKVIFETCYLTNQEIELCSKIAKEIKPDFIKTSTGFGPNGATLEHVSIMSNTVGKDVGVKAAGGIRDLDTFEKMVQNGATRIGTSSGISIVKEYRNKNNRK